MLKICYSIFPRKCLRTIHYLFVLPYLQYGIELRGSTYSSYLEPLRVLQKHPSQHVQLGHRWGPDGLSLGPLVDSPLEAQLTLATVFKWVPTGLPIWASPSEA